MTRRFWLAFGACSQLLFALTVYRLFLFLRGGTSYTGWLSERVAGRVPWFAADAVLALQFAVFHSVLLYPAVRKALVARIPGPVYGCFFCVATCVSLLLVTEGWQPRSAAAWHLQTTAGWLVTGAFLLSWTALIYSLALTGFGYQTGWTTWWAWALGREQSRRDFAPKGAYRVLRHPVYLSFLGLIWFNPVMTYDRLTLAALWTTHIFVGSYLKDRRLVHYLGAAYRGYQSRVPGYPLIGFGPLGKVPTAQTEM